MARSHFRCDRQAQAAPRHRWQSRLEPFEASLSELFPFSE